MNVQDQTRALLRTDEPAVLRAVADYLAASYVPEPATRNWVARAIRRHLGGDDGGC